MVRKVINNLLFRQGADMVRTFTYHSPKITIESPDFHPWRSQICLVGCKQSDLHEYKQSAFLICNWWKEFAQVQEVAFISLAEVDFFLLHKLGNWCKELAQVWYATMGGWVHSFRHLVESYHMEYLLLRMEWTPPAYHCAFLLSLPGARQVYIYTSVLHRTLIYLSATVNHIPFLPQS